MKKRISLFFMSSLILSSSFSLFTINSKHALSLSSNLNPNLETASKYAKDTSIVAKSLLVGQDKGFNTTDLVNNMYKNTLNPSINNLTGANTGNDFIKNWTSNLDVSSIDTIQSLFQRNGAHQAEINAIATKINTYENITTLAPLAKNYMTNDKLANDKIIDMVDGLLKEMKSIVPKIDEYLQYTNYLPIINDALVTLNSDWVQPDSIAGDTLVAKMKNYVKDNAAFTQGWVTTNGSGKGNWYYVESRAKAKGWTWNDFYEYIAGANFNYMFKQIAGKYIGEMISDNLYLSKAWFDADTFTASFTAAFNKIITTPAVWPYLTQALVPIIKTKILNLEQPTKAVTNIRWGKNTTNSAMSKALTAKNEDLQLQQVLTELQKILSSKDELLKIVASLLQGSFGEDIIIKATPMWIPTYWTMPEIQDKFSWLTAEIRDIPNKIVTPLMQLLEKVDIKSIFNKILDATNQYLITDPLINLQDLLSDLGKTVTSSAFLEALKIAKDIIINPDRDPTSNRTKQLFETLGVQFKQGQDFVAGSFFANLKTLLNTNNSSLNKIISIFIDSNDKTGIINNMLKEQKELYQTNYAQFFDINNVTYFEISNIKMHQYYGVGNVKGAILTYKLTSKLNDKKVSYDVVFKNNNVLSTKNFALTSFHLSFSN